jgi:CDP-diacylglycerol--serine O-phosphatidyltransferase
MARQREKIPFSQRKKRRKERIQEETGLRKRKRLKYIAVLPTAVTLMNGFCGFLSIIYASKGPGVFLEVFLMRETGITFFAFSGYLIFCAMIADMLDGQVARWSGTSSGFGGQLDSLSDVLSFGAAPAFLMYKIMEAHFGLEAFARRFFFPVSLWKAFPSVSPRLAQLAGSWILFLAIFYVLCAVIRLARFNVENDTDPAFHQNFIGLPSPGAAGFVVSLIIFQEDFIGEFADRWPELTSSLLDLTSWLLPLAVFTGGILMVTRIRYPHMANRLRRRKQSFLSVLLILFSLFLAVWNIQLALLLGFWTFPLVGLVRGIYTRITRKAAKPVPE